jgi:hypothetical protein
MGRPHSRAGGGAIPYLLFSALVCGVFAFIGSGPVDGAAASPNGAAKVGVANQRAVEEPGRQKTELTPPSDDNSDVWGNFFPWSSDEGFSSNFLSGLGLALLGVFGALVTIYLFLGEFLPSMGGKAEYEAIGLELEDLVNRRDKQLAPRERFTRDSHPMDTEQRDEAAKLTQDLNGIIQSKEKAAQKVKRELVAMGFPLYVLLGGAFAVLLASNAPQALLIGFGWTAVVDRFGLKRELGEKSRKRDSASVKLVEEANEAALTKAKLAKAESERNEAMRVAATATAALATQQEKTEKT